MKDLKNINSELSTGSSSLSTVASSGLSGVLELSPEDNKFLEFAPSEQAAKYYLAQSEEKKKCIRDFLSYKDGLVCLRFINPANNTDFRISLSTQADREQISLQQLPEKYLHLLQGLDVFIGYTTDKGEIPSDSLLKNFSNNILTNEQARAYGARHHNLQELFWLLGGKLGGYRKGNEIHQQGEMGFIKLSGSSKIPGINPAFHVWPSQNIARIGHVNPDHEIPTYYITQIEQLPLQ